MIQQSGQFRKQDVNRHQGKTAESKGVSFLKQLHLVDLLNMLFPKQWEHFP